MAGDSISFAMDLTSISGIQDLISTDQNKVKSIFEKLLYVFYSPAIQYHRDMPVTGGISLSVARINDEVFESMYQKLSDEPLIVNYYDDTTVNGKINVKRSGFMLTSITYDKRWHIYVNGTEQPSVKLMGSLLGLPLDKGEYQIELKYKPDPTGWTYIFCIAALVFLGFTSRPHAKS